MNVNSSSLVNTQGKITLDDIKNSQDRIKDLDENTLNSFFNQSINVKDYDVVVLLAQELSDRAKIPEAVDSNLDWQKNLIEDSFRKEEQNAQIQKELVEKNSPENEKKKQEEITDLKKQLEDSDVEIKNLQESIDNLRKDLSNNNEKNSKTLEDIIKARNSGDRDTIARSLAIIRNLIKEKEELRAEMKKIQEENKKYKEAESIPGYDDDIKNNKGDVIGKTGDKIDKLDTKWIDAKLFPLKTKEGRSSLSLGEISVVRNLRTRRRINKTIGMFNKIGDDPAKGLKYFLAKSYLTKGGKIGMALQRVKNRASIDSKTQLDELFEKQKKSFIDDLKENLGKNGLSEKDENSIKQIESRLNYYHKRYKNDFIKLK